MSTLAETLCKKLEIPVTSIKLEDQLGRGNLGTVYKSFWNGADVAVEVVQQQQQHSPLKLEREVAVCC
jgi:predicted Ser/Thr protein kinase